MVSTVVLGLIAIPWTLFGLERGLHLFTRLGKKLDTIRVNPRLGLYGVFSYFLITSLYIVGFYGLNFLNQDLITYNYIAGHWLSWFFIVAVVARYGYLDFMRGLYAAGFLYGVHEGYWFLTYLATHLYEYQAVLSYYWPLESIIGGVLVGYLTCWRVVPRHKELIVVVFLLGFYVLWGLSGFHTSVDALVYGAKTQWFLDPAVNLNEIEGWAMPAILLLAPSLHQLRSYSHQ